jgi:hypothetical protein
MERSSKRGKIPQNDWPSIIKRYEAGETLASIARTYDCSPPAISYIVSRSRAREAISVSVPAVVAVASEPQLVKGHTNEMAIPKELGDAPEVGEMRSNNVEVKISVELPTEQHETGLRQAPDDLAEDTGPQRDVANGVTKSDDMNIPSGGTSLHIAAPAQSNRGGPRRTLHLSLSQENAHGSDLQQQHSPSGPNSPDSGKSPAMRSTGDEEQGSLQPGRGGVADHTPPTNGGSIRMVTEPHRVKDADAFIDQALRERVDGDITAFLAAFDAALAQDTVESRTGLRDATDRLLRAGARTRIQLERLEARVPLPLRDGHAVPTWRAR